MFLALLIRPNRKWRVKLPQYLPSDNHVCCSLATQALLKADFFFPYSGSWNKYVLSCFVKVSQNSLFKTKRSLFIWKFREHRVQGEIKKRLNCIYVLAFSSTVYFLESFSNFHRALSSPVLHWWKSTASIGGLLLDQKLFSFFLFFFLFPRFLKKKKKEMLQFRQKLLFSINADI